MLEKSLRILPPVDTQVPIRRHSIIGSDAGFSHDLPTHFTRIIKDHHVSAEECDYMINLTTHRFHFMYSKAHGLAYLSNPEYVSQGSDKASRSKSEKSGFCARG